jgi:phage terminase small subunit
VSEIADTLSKTEKALRDRFVGEYLVDYDPFGAALRIGYSEVYAKQYARTFMLEPYVRSCITKQEEKLGLVTEEEKHRQKIVAGLYRIARSPTSPASAQVAAYTQLAKISGIEAPVKTQQEVKLTSTSPELSHLSVAELEKIKSMMYVTPTK